MSTSVLKKLQNGWTRTFRFSFAPHGFFERVMYRTLNMTQYTACTLLVTTFFIACQVANIYVAGLKAVHCWATGLHLESPNVYLIITYAMHPYHLTIEVRWLQLC